MTRSSARITPPTRRGRHRPAGSGVLLAVYAPFGSDPVLSRHPLAQQPPITGQPILAALQAVASQGADVAALVDLFRDDTWLVEIPAHAPSQMRVTSTWKQRMTEPQTLAGFLRRAHARFPCDALVLALEGHGAGYVPEIEPSRLTPDRTSAGGTLQWRLEIDAAAPFDGGGNPVLPGVPYPELGADSPEVLPVTLPMSSWALAEGLRLARAAKVPDPVVIHFDNCFNMALEHLHALAGRASWATGYANYNYFTACAAYPSVFERLRLAGGATAQELAQWFAAGNRDLLAAQPGHPSIGATVDLRRIGKLAGAVDALADALSAALVADRAATRPRLQAAIAAAQQYDSNGDYRLDVPDQTTDLGSLAVALSGAYASGDPIHQRAADVLAALAGAWQYGETGAPYMAPGETWAFGDKRLGMGILLPDPDLQGRWDWRSPYYMAGRADPGQPPALWQQVPFLADRGSMRAPWPRFIEEYHRGVPFKALGRVQLPVFPVFGRPKDGGPQDGRKRPRAPRPGRAKTQDRR